MTYFHVLVRHPNLVVPPPDPHLWVPDPQAAREWLRSSRFSGARNADYLLLMYLIDAAVIDTVLIFDAFALSRSSEVLPKRGNL